MKKYVPLLLILFLTFSQSASAFLMGGDGAVAFGPGAPGFLSTCSSVFSNTNILQQSQTFSTATWVKQGTGVTAAAITANSTTAPDSTMTASTLTLPAVSAGTNGSYIYQTTSSLAQWPYTGDIYVKGVVGGETIWISSTNTGSAGTWTETKIVATTSWQRVVLPWINKAASQQIEIGIDLRDSAQTAQSAQSVYIWGAQLIGNQREWNYIPTTNAQVTARETDSCPTGTAFRDFSTLTFNSSVNPITPQNTASYNAGGVSNPFAAPWGQVGGVYFGFANGTVTGTNRPNWFNQNLYTGNGTTSWTDYSAGNPVLTHTAAAWDDHYLLHGVLAPTCGIANWCYYYSAMNTSNNSSIGIAISNDALTGIPTHWTKYSGNPLTLTAPGVVHPSLPTMIEIGTTLYMYTASTNNSSPDIVFWTSPASDGVNWTFGGVALRPTISGDWDANYGFDIDPTVFKNSHGFYEMAYTAFGGTIPPIQEVGYAISADGINWYKYLAGPIIYPGSLAYPGATNTGDTIFMEDPTNFSVLYNFDDGSTLSAGEIAQMPDH